MPVTGVILAGGRGTRMGGQDKGWIELDGRPLIEHVLARFAPQVDEVLISVNRNLERYAALGHPVLPDVSPGFLGPLAGLHAGLSSARNDLVVTAPCDSPWLPLDLVARLRRALDDAATQAAIPRAGGRLHRAFLLCRRSLAADVEAYLARGGRRVQEWCAQVRCIAVDFEDEARAFRNLNTPDDLGAPGSRPHG
jgi:molybdopterin-guanine dinucleotide biosynthesis protein A